MSKANQLAQLTLLIQDKIEFRDTVAFYDRKTLRHLGLQEKHIDLVIGKVCALPWKPKTEKTEKPHKKAIIICDPRQLKYSGFYGCIVTVLSKSTHTSKVEYLGKQFDFPNDIIFYAKDGDKVKSALKRIRELRSIEYKPGHDPMEKWNEKLDKIETEIETHIDKHGTLRGFRSIHRCPETEIWPL